MSYKHLGLLTLILIALFIGYGFGRLFAFPDGAWLLEKGERVVIAPGETLTQPFVANREGLRRIEILFGKFSLEDEDRLVLELRDGACNTVLAQKTLSRQSFDSEYTHSFVFPRVNNTKNDALCLALSFSSNRPLKKDKMPRLFIDESATGSPYSLLGVAEPSTGTHPIAIRPGYTDDSFFTNAKEFFDRISQYKPVFLKSWFLITFAALGLVLTFLVIVLLIREERE